MTEKELPPGKELPYAGIRVVEFPRRLGPSGVGELSSGGAAGNAVVVDRVEEPADDVLQLVE